MKIENRLIRLALINSLLFVVGGLISFLALWSSTHEWESYLYSVKERREILLEAYSQAGYGNGIHAFKNLVLRRDPVYRDRAARTLDLAVAELNRYLEIPQLTASETRTIRIFRDVLTQYRHNVDVAAGLIARGRSVAEIDRAVAIDDLPAIAALEALRDELSARQITASEQLAKRRLQIFVALSVFFGGGLLLGILAARRVSKNMTGRLGALLESSRKIAREQLDEPVKVPGDDELNFLAERMDEMRAHLKGSLEGLRRSNAELERFAFVASHDLQEPLKKIQIYGDLLEHECAGSLGEDGNLYVSKIRASSRHMSEIILSVMEYARLSGDNGRFAEVDLDALLSEIEQDMEITIRERGATVAKEGTLPKVAANRAQLKQWFQNLISNAIKFAKDREPARVTVRAVPARVAGRIKLQVADEGIGFDPAQKHKIVAPFGRLHPRSRYPGAGIGLAICSRVAENHGSELEIESEPGLGSRFGMELPLA